jgi:hypothetical protein
MLNDRTTNSKIRFPVFFCIYQFFSLVALLDLFSMSVIRFVTSRSPKYRGVYPHTMSICRIFVSFSTSATEEERSNVVYKETSYRVRCGIFYSKISQFNIFFSLLIRPRSLFKVAVEELVVSVTNISGNLRFDRLSE